MFPVACGRTWQPIISLLRDAPAHLTVGRTGLKMEGAPSSAAVTASIPKIIQFGFKEIKLNKRNDSPCARCAVLKYPTHPAPRQISSAIPDYAKKVRLFPKSLTHSLLPTHYIVNSI